MFSRSIQFDRHESLAHPASFSLGHGKVCGLRCRYLVRIAALLLGLLTVPRAAAAGPLDALSDSPVLGGMPYSTSGPSSTEEYTHIFSTDVWDPNRFFYTNRPNMLNQRVSDEWDAMKLINTDRPDFTDVATVVGRGVTQIETGYTFSDYYNRVSRIESNSVPESLIRYGTSERFEWRMKWQGYLDTHTSDIATGTGLTQQGLSDLQLGFKWIALEQENWRPLQTIVTRMLVPMGSSNFSGNTVQPGFSYIYSWQVRKWWFIRGSNGVDWFTSPLASLSPGGAVAGATPTTYNFTIQRDSYVQGFQSISSYMQISQRVGTFAEWYVLFRHGTTDDRPQHFHDYGLYFYLDPNFQLDVRIGQQISHDVNNWFTGAGVSARF